MIHSLEPNVMSNDEIDVDELLMFSDVDASLQNLALKHHLAMKSVGNNLCVA